MTQANELTYGELMLLCDGHGTSEIYERHCEITDALHTQLAQVTQERNTLRLEVDTLTQQKESWKQQVAERDATIARLGDERIDFQFDIIALRDRVATLEVALTSAMTRLRGRVS